MHHFEYATRKIRKPERDDIIKLLKLVQKDLKRTFTFSYNFVGSDSLNLVTYDPKTNTGFDFDLNIYPNEVNQYTPKDLKNALINSLDKFAHQFNFDFCQNNTRVITLKVKDKSGSKILYSCDIAIVNDYLDNSGNKRQEIILFNKKQNSYEWKEQPKPYYDFYSRIKKIKSYGLWQQVRNLYLIKKNNNTNSNKSSRSLRIETVNEIYQSIK